MNQTSSQPTNEKNSIENTYEKESPNIDNVDTANTNISTSSSKTKKKSLLSPKNDYVFQTLFSQGNEDLTRGFISDLLDEDIESLKINDTKELFRKNPFDKLGILDLEAEVNGKEKVDIEIQLIDTNNFTDRLLFYFARLYDSQLSRGDEYADTKRVVIIAIIDYNLELTKEIPDMVAKWKLLAEENPNLVLTDKIEIDIIELKKAKQAYNLNKNDKKAQWMMFINNPESKEVSEIMENNDSIKKAKLEIVKLSEDEEKRKLAELRAIYVMEKNSCYSAGVNKGIKIGEELGEKRGEQRGEQRGKLNNQIEIAKKLIALKMPEEQIAEVTGLSIDEIKKLSH